MRGIARRVIRPPLRVRITLAATVSIGVILMTLSLFVYGRLHAELLRALDSGLQARAAAIAGGLGQADSGPTTSGRPDPLNRFLADGPDTRLASATQIMTPDGRVLAHSGALIPEPSAALLRALRRPVFTQVPSQGQGGALRLYLVPVNEGRPLVVVVASTMAGLSQTLGSLRLLLLVGDPAALGLACVVAWLMTGAALRPIERMRREAAAISATDPAVRLPVPDTHDEVARLGETLNSLLDRLQAARDHERRLLDDASHELRTPLSALKAELDLALSRERSAAELQLALESASEETNRLSRLAQDLLVLSRARDGGIALHRVPTALGEVIERACARHQPRAAQADYRIECQAPDVEILADPMRLTQAVDNLLDNAVRYSDGGGIIRVRAEVTANAASIEINNPGPGFPPFLLDRAFEPFVSGGQQATPGAGLGLAIVQAVANAHGGSATARNVPGGASVSMTIARGPVPAAARCESTEAGRTAATDRARAGRR
jgi:two-component system OmpR family sensor kinase